MIQSSLSVNHNIEHKKGTINRSFFCFDHHITSIRNQGFFAQLFGRLDAVEYAVQRLEYLDIFHVNAFVMQSEEMPSEYPQMKIHLQSNHALINIAQDTKHVRTVKQIKRDV